MALIDAGHLAGAVLLVRPDFAGMPPSTAPSSKSECTWRPLWIPGTKGGGRWWCYWIEWLAGQNGPPVHIRKRRSDLT
jgi:hypothetical protein